jgi:hypothetical protein
VGVGLRFGRRLTAPLTFIISARGDKRIPPHPYPLPRRGEERRKMKRFKQCPSPLPSPAEWRGKKEDEKILTVRGEIFSGGVFELLIM